MQIIDVNGKDRTVESISVINHKVKDVVNNKMVNQKYVEANIIYRTGRIGKEWYALDVFKEFNPTIKI